MSDERGTESAAQSTEEAKLPTVTELRAIVRSKQSDALERQFNRTFSHVAIDGQEKYEHLKGLRDHYKHKGRWSNFLMWVMAGMVIFQSTLLGLVGGGVWDFSAYEWLLPALLVQNLAQIIGLAVFVVKALFKDIKG